MSPAIAPAASLSALYTPVRPAISPFAKTDKAPLIANKRLQQIFRPGHVHITSRRRTHIYGIRAAWNPLAVQKSGGTNYYEVLQVTEDVDFVALKAAYRTMAKYCHPDIMGEEGHNACILINEAYRVLSDPELRAAYDYQRELLAHFGAFDHGYTGEPLSRWSGPFDEDTAVFVDESTCIGCKNCTHCASLTFSMEDEYGRARVTNQWADNEEDIVTAIESCPVDCIHRVPRAELPVLEFVMSRANRVNVASFMAGGAAGDDPFAAAEEFKKRRAEKMAVYYQSGFYETRAQEAARDRARRSMREVQKEARARQNGFWSKIFGGGKTNATEANSSTPERMGAIVPYNAEKRARR